MEKEREAPLSRSTIQAFFWSGGSIDFLVSTDPNAG
jgi:hypothetical protein